VARSPSKPCRPRWPTARFDVFGLVDAILNGEAAHALRMLEGCAVKASSRR
jgi:hypothetical protein